MKKFLAMILLVAMLLPAASALEIGEGLDVRVVSVRSEAVENDDTVDNLVLDVSVTNWNTQTVSVAEAIQAKVVFADKYEFPGDVDFGRDSIDPLIRLEGTVCFRLPSMVTDSDPEAIQLTITADGKTIPVQVEALSAGAPESAPESFECEGFADPESAARAYVEALKNQDFAKAASTFAIETFVENADYDTYANYLKMMRIDLLQYLPVENRYFTQLKHVYRYYDVARSMAYGYLFNSCAGDETLKDFAGGVVSVLNEEGSVEAFREALLECTDAFSLDTISILEVGESAALPDTPEHYFSESSRKNIANRAAQYGCDETRDMFVRMTINGEAYIQFLECARYGDRWYNMSLSGPYNAYIGLSLYTGGLTPVSELM